MRIVSAKNGGAWLSRGLALFRKSPAMWVLLVFTYWLLTAVINNIPYVGPAIATVSLPAFYVSFMAACEELAQGRPLTPLVLFAGFRKELAALLMLGGFYLISIAAVLWISSLADSGALMNWVIWGQTPPAAAIRDGSLSRALAIAALGAAPVLSALWFAPILAAWERMGVAKSLFYSFFATWRNWRAFIIYTALLALLSVALSLLIALITLAFRGHPDGARLAIMLATLVVMPTVFGSFYACYRDIFPQPPGEADAPGSPAI